MTRMVSQFDEAVGCLEEPEGILAAFSGGPDSAALLSLCCSWRDRGGPAVVAAHLDHGLRPDSAGDLSFCQSLCRDWDVPFRGQRIEVEEEQGRGGLEARARTVRYGFLTQVAREEGLDWIVTGHNHDDQAETVLMRILRGTGMAGLGGIPHRRRLASGGRHPQWLVRPLLGVRRREIQEYVRETGIPVLHDSSNEDPRFLRNRIRREIFPRLRQGVEGRVEDVLVGLSLKARAWVSHAEEKFGGSFDKFVCTRADGLWISSKLMKNADPMELHVVLTRTFQEAGVPGERIERGHFQALRRLLSGDRDTRRTLPGGVRLLPHPEGLLLKGEQETELSPHEELPFGLEAEVESLRAGLRISSTAPMLRSGEWAPLGSPLEEEVDLAGAPLPWRIRFRRPGDRFHPLGASGGMKLKKFLNQRKVPREERDRVALVVDGWERVLWVVGWQLSDHGRIRDGTREVVRLTAKPMTTR